MVRATDGAELGGFTGRVQRDERVALLAEAQYGVFSRAQAMVAGHNSHSIRVRLNSGRWAHVLYNVFGLVGVAHRREQDLMAAHLWAGLDSVCCGRSSAGLWGACSLPSDLIDLCVPRKIHSPSKTLLLHRPVSLPQEDVTRKAGIPVTVLDRALYELAGLVSFPVLEHAVDEALRRRLVWLPALHARLERHAVQGRNGTTNLRRVLQERPLDYRATDSPLEDDFVKLLEAYSLPKPERQFRIEGVGRVDFAYPDARIAIELDGYEYHSDRGAFQTDRTRSNKLSLGEWMLLRYTKNDVTSHAALVAEQLLKALHARLEKF
jgi:very-short-patch-repair endonuclease